MDVARLSSWDFYLLKRGDAEYPAGFSGWAFVYWCPGELSVSLEPLNLSIPAGSAILRA